LIDQGTHAALLERCDMYRRIFAHHGKETRPLYLEHAQEEDIDAAASRAAPGTHKGDPYHNTASL